MFLGMSGYGWWMSLWGFGWGVLVGLVVIPWLLRSDRRDKDKR